jgi:hypothetical protein
MRRLMLAMGAAATVAVGAFGCSHTISRAGAEYHQEKAERAAARGNYYKAAKEQRKADRDEYRASRAPLP